VKKYGDDTPIESKAHPKNKGAMMRATPHAMIRNEQIALMPSDGGYYRNTPAETWKKSANAFACALLMARFPFTNSETRPRPPRIGTKSACFVLRLSIKCCRILCGGESGMG
jgi:hypothetical protein